ncbi:MAG: cytochrome c [Bacteroidetes bacterium]|nr:cytochrome c [Bacteroidota bacterium]
MTKTICGVNKQVNSIIYAMLLSLSLLIGYYFIDKIVATEIVRQNQSTFIDRDVNTEFVTASKSVYLGKSLFDGKCASCHLIFKNSTGPALMSLEERGPWSDRTELYNWIRNPAKFMSTNGYTKNLKKEFGSMMQAFPDLTNAEINAIVDYINASQSMRQVIY